MRLAIFLRVCFAFETKEDLKAHLQFLKEAKERDHKILGPQLDLFFMDSTAPEISYYYRGWKLFNTILILERGA